MGRKGKLSKSDTQHQSQYLTQSRNWINTRWMAHKHFKSNKLIFLTHSLKNLLLHPIYSPSCQECLDANVLHDNYQVREKYSKKTKCLNSNAKPYSQNGRQKNYSKSFYFYDTHAAHLSINYLKIIWCFKIFTYLKSALWAILRLKG